jgi:hypothetical protein
MTDDRFAMTRRLALGSSVFAGVCGVTIRGGSAQSGADQTPITQALIDRLRGTLRASDLEHFAELMHPAVRTLAWTGSTELDVVGPTEYRDAYLAPYVRNNPDLRLTVTKVLSNGVEVVAFYDVSALVDGKPSAWSGCNVYLTDGERITEQWIEQDLWWRSRASPTVNSAVMREQAERHFKPQTTAANIAGMGRLMSYKNSMLPGGMRISGFIDMLAPNAVQTSWEPHGTVLLPNQQTIRANFQDGLLRAIPDFWEAVRRAVIIGNMLVLIQIPSGNVTLPDGKVRFCAWYNCDAFFFDAELISYVLFQRDVMYDLSQRPV